MIIMSDKTTITDPQQVSRDWIVANAEGKVLGRLATRIATLLRGKHKPEWQPNIDIGDFVVVINAEKILLTGKKLEQKFHRRHSGYPGNMKEYNYKWMIENRPERVIELAVGRMLPKNRLGRAMIRKLKVYRGPDHPHDAQGPKLLE